METCIYSMQDDIAQKKQEFTAVAVAPDSHLLWEWMAETWGFTESSGGVSLKVGQV